MSGVPRERNDITDVIDARGKENEALKAKAEASMGHTAILTQVAVPWETLTANRPR